MFYVKGLCSWIRKIKKILAPAWYFDNEDRHVPIDIDAWYGRKGKQCGEYTKPDGKFQFFSASEDLEMVFSKLEERHNIILNLHDPYFRIDGNGECVHVWRREWEERLAS